MFEISNTSSKDLFLEQAKAARLERALEKKREQATLIIQAYTRGYISRKTLKQNVKKEFDETFLEFTESNKLPPVIDMYKVIRKLIFVISEDVCDRERFEKVCKYIIASLDSDSLKKSYIAVAFNKDLAVGWIHHIKIVLWQCCVYLKSLKPEWSQDAKAMMLFLHMLVSFTSIGTWKVLNNKQGEALKPAMNQLCANIMGFLVSKGLYSILQTVLLRGLVRVKPCLKRATLLAITNISTRPLASSQYSNNLLNLFLLHIVSVPALVLHFHNSAPECLGIFSSNNIFKHAIDLLVSEQNTRILFNALEGNYALCLIANLIHLGHSDIECLQSNLLDFINVITKILESCQKYVVNKQSNLTHWHPVLGWFAQKVDHGLHDSLSLVKKQIQLLWSGPMIKAMFSHLVDSVTNAPQPSSPTANNPATSPVQNSPFKTNIFKKALEKASSSRTSNVRFKRLGSPETTLVALTCNLYETALATLSQMKLDILTGLCYQDMVLPHLWKFICSLGTGNGLKAFLDHLAVTTKTCSPEFQILVLFCDCATHLITILDDVELYEQQKPFCLEDLVSISSFLNQLVFKLIWNNLIDSKAVKSNALLNSAHTLLMLLYKRDCRHPYTPADHWLIKDIRVSSFMNDLEKGKKAAQVLMQKVPHIIPHKERVVLFRKYVNNEKEVLGLTESACASPQSTLITVHRSRIVEDGYQQLSMLPSQSLKGVIRVKFINEQGLDEAGIDQDGVFKEFLEETIKKVFDPSLNLFRATSEERLFPSPTSYIHENHLSLFEFVGKMLGKAVYEGIVVDVPFASFFLSQVLGHTHSALYSSIDELPSLDPELYKSLTYIKHFSGELHDLDLTFSIDEDCMGQLVTHELVPGGKAVPVTSENKISYIHLMAHFRMHVQINDQTNAFIRGFRSIVNPDWLTMFSTPELQRLISGDNTPVDLVDLRKHTKYFGGFHNNHRVINWLWDVLEKDFTQEEHRMFLKFVTSCSKPPLLGFAHLEPAFSIRCVEVSDDQDTGDTVGSVLRGFFTIRKKDPVNRLPTSSTCFNLLKLPNYQKKSTLREKLRYAITCNTGFELS
ncbi:ubiquitin-protein ligase E3B [Parasteatoda tepidariorum]|uniref:ubiquitin-protein ligase E3B n=1 Tax=Parasteatoda tepidariorum TaxID=114398 RepID=UPI000A2C0469|nr:ubiquitin-protein ligase E3B [Parasteatoda tepidariorum]